MFSILTHIPPFQIGKMYAVLYDSSWQNFRICCQQLHICLALNKSTGALKTVNLPAATLNKSRRRWKRKMDFRSSSVSCVSFALLAPKHSLHADVFSWCLWLYCSFNSIATSLVKTWIFIHWLDRYAKLKVLSDSHAHYCHFNRKQVTYLLNWQLRQVTLTLSADRSTNSHSLFQLTTQPCHTYLLADSSTKPH